MNQAGDALQANLTVVTTTNFVERVHGWLAK